MIEIIKPGCFAPKIFFICKTKEELKKVYFALAEHHKATCPDIENYVLSQKGCILYVRQTLMQWGVVSFFPNTPTKHNALLEKGYKLCQSTDL